MSDYEQNLDAKDRREAWMDQRWPELCHEMALEASKQTDGTVGSGIFAEIKDMLEDSDTLAELCYDAEEQANSARIEEAKAEAAISRMEDR